MDETGRKILIGILIAIFAGVCVYLVSRSATAFPPDVSTTPSAAATQMSIRPAGDGTISPEASAVARAMVGVWRSMDDPKFTREFKEDGTSIDRYEGDASATKGGIWGTFTGDMAPAGTSTGLSSGVVYIQMTIGSESLYFSVVRAADTLELIYLDRGGQSNFTRVQ